MIFLTFCVNTRVVERHMAVPQVIKGPLLRNVRFENEKFSEKTQIVFKIKIDP